MTLRSLIPAAAGLALGALAAAAPAAAAGVSAGDITVSNAWARATAGPAKAGAAFMHLKNKGDTPDKVVSADADVSKVVELHTHVMQDGMMKMREVPSIPVPADGATMLEPGGYHIMFIGLTEPLQKGASFPLTLTFEKAGTVTVTVDVKAAGSMGGTDMEHGSMDHE